MRVSLFLIIVLISITTSSCDNATAVTPGTKGGNVVTGIFITSEISPEPIAIWGNPRSSEELDIGTEPPEDENSVYHRYLELHPPYPIPANGNFIVVYTIPKTVKVDLWIETAYWPGEDALLPLHSHAQRPFQSVSLAEGEKLSPGTYSYNVGIKTKCTGGEMEAGFYRVYLRVDMKYLLWHDIYLAGNGPVPELDRIGLYGRKCSDF